MPENEVKNRQGKCADIGERLPFYINQSLDADEARQIEEHLVDCAACRQEERNVRTALALYEGHLPVELILDYALGEPMTARRREVIESHLATCQPCAVEYASVRSEPVVAEAVAEVVPLARAQIPPDRGRPDRGRPDRGTSRRWVALALAACLATVVASAGWIWTWRQVVEQRSLVPTARANLAVVELLPTRMDPLREGLPSTEGVINQVSPGESLDEVVLMLLGGGDSCQKGCSLERHDGDSEDPSWRLEGLMPSEDGHLTLAVPGDWLSQERIVLAVRDGISGELVAEYLLEVPARKEHAAQ